MNNQELSNTKIATRCVLAGYIPENKDPSVMPIVQSTTYKFDTIDELGSAFDLKVAAHMYTRLGNPTLSYLEEKINSLEGGIGAITTSSGQAANLFAVLNLAQGGDHIIASSNLYGGTHTLFGSQIKRLGIEVDFVDPSLTLEELKKYVKKNTKCIFGEVLANPALDVLDFEKFKALANYADAPLVVDNSFPTPYLCQPLKHGADIVTHSTSKFLDGHGTSVGGVIVDGGSFNWRNEKYPQFNQPDLDYHGLVYTEAFGELAFILRARASLLRDLGATMSPQNAYLTNLGIETLHLRMKQHSENALKVAQYLENHPKVAWVNYPYLESSKSYELAKKYLPKGASGVLTFGMKDGEKASRNVIDKLKLISLVTHVGFIKSCMIHPASTTHRQLSKEELKKAGVPAELIRFNVGIEDIDDIIADLEQALS